MNLEELAARVQTLEDIEEIKRLQRIYGYYLDNNMWDEIIDLFSDDTESIEVADHGVFLGKEGIRKFFRGVMGGGKDEPSSLSGMARVMQLQGVVDVDPGGKTARGRWQGWIFGTKTVEGKPRQFWAHGIYVDEYIKENGKWKFKKMHFNRTFQTPYEDGWLKTPTFSPAPRRVEPDEPSTAYHPYPSGYVVPFHWKHPVTGK